MKLALNADSQILQRKVKQKIEDTTNLLNVMIVILNILLTENNMTQITTIEGIIPKIQTLSLSQMQLNAKIVEKESELANLPDVIRLQSEILELKKSKREVELEETGLRDEGKKILLDSGMKEFTTLDGTTIALQFTP